MPADPIAVGWLPLQQPHREYELVLVVLLLQGLRRPLELVVQVAASLYLRLLANPRLPLRQPRGESAHNGLRRFPLQLGRVKCRTNVEQARLRPTETTRLVGVQP